MKCQVVNGYEFNSFMETISYIMGITNPLHLTKKLKLIYSKINQENVEIREMTLEYLATNSLCERIKEKLELDKSLEESNQELHILQTEQQLR